MSYKIFDRMTLLDAIVIALTTVLICSISNFFTFHKGYNQAIQDVGHNKIKITVTTNITTTVNYKHFNHISTPIMKENKE